MIFFTKMKDKKGGFFIRIPSEKKVMGGSNLNSR